MTRPITLVTGQWADLPLAELAEKARSFGFEGLELACSGDHIEVDKANVMYCQSKLELLRKHGLSVYAISAHLPGQAVCDLIDLRHKNILPDYVWGNGDPEGVRQRAANEVIRIGEVAVKLGVKIVTGFTGSSIWHMLYSFPPVSQEMIIEGYADFSRRWIPILDAYQSMGIKFALEVHPSEIAFDIETAHRALKAIDYHPAFGFNFDPSHLGYQGVDYIRFIYEFRDWIFHVHIKDAYWNDQPGAIGVFGGHTEFGDNRRFWNFRSIGRGRVDFEKIIRALNDIGYHGPLSVEWEDSGMDRFMGAKESLEYIRNKDFIPSSVAFDKVFQKGTL